MRRDFVREVHAVPYLLFKAFLDRGKSLNLIFVLGADTLLKRLQLTLGFIVLLQHCLTALMPVFAGLLDPGQDGHLGHLKLELIVLTGECCGMCLRVCELLCVCVCVCVCECMQED